MSVNGTEVSTDAKPSPGSLPDGRAAKPGSGQKTSVAKVPTARRRRGEGGNTSADGDERFFLAAQDGEGGVPAFGRECTNEAEAIIEAFRGRVNFYQVCEYGTRADVGSSRRPVLQKEVIKKANRQSAS
jgi:hypothetical protein